MLNIQRVSLRMVCALAVLLVSVLALNAKAQAGSCPTSITSCGCTINRPGSYAVVNELNFDQGLTGRGDCIDITASKVILDGGDEDVDGNGSGVGVRTFPGAELAVIQNFDEIDDWNIGVKVQSLRATVTSSDITDNTSAQVLLQGANNANVTFDFVGVEGAGEGPCILVKNSKSDTISNVESMGCTGGIVVENSLRTSIASSLFAFSFGDGIFFDAGSSHGAKIASNCVGDNDDLGIEIGKGNTKNQISANCVLFDDDGTDLLDDNPNCAKDIWNENTYTDEGGASPACASAFSDGPCETLAVPFDEGEACVDFLEDEDDAGSLNKLVKSTKHAKP
jgi:hypothetical protein